MLAAAPRIEVENPFPGLRSFTSEESHLFFGREGQSDELLRKMDRRRFTAVVGVSGSGKSSLVRAGLLPSLYNGYLARAGAEWRVADFRPGGDPVQSLATALSSTGLWEGGLDAAALRTSSLALVGAARRARESGRWPEGENLLILADQFEELFRFRVRQDSDMADRDEKAAFVKLLLEAAGQPELPLYVVVTMRSDFLGDCAQFRDLPEAINEGQYLIPRMTREQRRSAIEAPVRLAGAAISPRLVQRILNDAGEEPGQLPVIQHALMRTWDHWRDRGQSDCAVDIEAYEAIGAQAHALSTHADEAFEEACQKLPGRGEDIVKRIFQRLRERDANGREVRRPTALTELSAVAEATRDETLTVLECFRRERRSFLMPPPHVDLRDETQVDISHECLLSQWERLVGWVAEELESRRIYTRLADRAEEQQGAEHPDYLRGTQLQVAQDWWERRRPSAVWARRYHPGFQAAETFLSASQQKREQKRQREEEARRLEQERLEAEERREREARESRLRLESEARERELKKRNAYRLAGLAALLAVFGILLSSLAWQQKVTADRAREEALRQEGQATTSKEEALKQKVDADKAREQALKQKGEADKAREEALKRKGEADKAKEEALTQKRQADSAKEQALEQKREADQLNARLEANELAAEAVDLNNDPDASAEMALKAFVRHEPATPRTKDALHDAIRALRPTWIVGPRRSPIRQVTFSPDGALLAVLESDGTLGLWDSFGKDRDPQLTESGVSSASFSLDGKLVIGGRDGWVRIRDGRGAPTWTEIAKLLQDAGVKDVAISPNGQRVAFITEDDRWAMRWNWKTDEPATRLGGSTLVNDLAFSPDGDRLAGGGEDGRIHVWDYESGGEVYSLPAAAPTTTALPSPTVQAMTSPPASSAIQSIAFSPDGDYLVAVDAEGSRRIWATSSKSSIAQELSRISQGPAAPTFRGRGEFAAVGLDGKVSIWSVRSRSLLSSGSILRAGPTAAPATSLAFSPDGSRLAAGEGDRRRDSSEQPAGADEATVRVWDVRPTSELLALEVPDAFDVSVVTLSRDRSMLLTAGRPDAGALGGVVHLWRAESGEPVATLRQTDAVLDAAFAADRSQVATASRAFLRRWSVPAGTARPSHEWPLPSLKCARFSADGRELAGAVGYTVAVWDVSSGRTALSLATDAQVAAVALSPDRLAWAGKDGRVRLVDRRSTVSRVLLDTPTDPPALISDLAFSPKGNLLAAATSGTKARLWDINGGDGPAILEGHTRAQSRVAFDTHADADRADRVAVTGIDGTTRIWDIPSLNRKPSVTLKGDAARALGVLGVVFADHDRVITTGDRTVRYYTLDGDELATLVVDRLIRAGGSSKVDLPSRLDKRLEDLRAGREIATDALKAAGLVANADGLASLDDAGAVVAATSLLARARELDPHLGFVPEQRAQQMAASRRVEDLIRGATEMIGKPNPADAQNRFKNAVDLERSFNLTPKTSAQSRAATAWIRQGLQLMTQSRIAEAKLAYQAASEFDFSEVTPIQWNTWCWQGSLRGLAEEVKDACERAVRADPGNPTYLDSRAVNRTLRRDFMGAISDFQVFVSWADERQRAQRQGWIDALKRGENPLDDDAEIKTLLNASSAPPSPSKPPSVEEARCYSLVQGQIAWDDEGRMNWAPGNARRLCQGTSRADEPPKCYDGLMHGGFPSGEASRWTPRDALALCAGSNSADGTLACLRATPALGDRADAIEACKVRASGN